MSDILILKNCLRTCEFHAISETQSLTLMISACAMWFEVPSWRHAFNTSSCTSCCRQSLSFIAYEGEYLLKCLVRYMFPFQRKDLLYFTLFLFSQSNMPVCFGPYQHTLILPFLKKKLTLKIRLQFQELSLAHRNLQILKHIYFLKHKDFPLKS